MPLELPQGPRAGPERERSWEIRGAPGIPWGWRSLTNDENLQGPGTCGKRVSWDGGNSKALQDLVSSWYSRS